MTICPCCGFRFEGDLRNGCEGCGARSVGEPLPKPERELPAYGRSLLLTVAGIVMVVGFLAETVASLFKNAPLSLGFSDWIAAGETAAWQLKWVVIPVTALVLLGGRRIHNSMTQDPARFVGLGIARRSLLASALVSVVMVTLIGVTVPARLRQRRMRIEAGVNARAYTLIRAQLEYRNLHGTIATDLVKDLSELPDHDGSIAAALVDVDPAGYQPRADIAVLPKGNGRALPGGALKNASISTVEAPAGGLSFTNYELRLAGEDKLMNTADDLIIRDGIVLKASEVKDALPVRTPTRAGKR